MNSLAMWKHYIFLFGGFYDPGIRSKSGDCLVEDAFDRFLTVQPITLMTYGISIRRSITGSRSSSERMTGGRRKQCAQAPNF